MNTQMISMIPSLQLLTAPKKPISATEPDWERETLRKWWEPSRQLLKSIRAYQKWAKLQGPFSALIRAIIVVQFRFWSVVTGADIPINSQIAGGLSMPHPHGIVVHPTASIGPNCLILQQVTITQKVKIGGHVDIGSGAKILRKVQIGDHAKIGANAVVLCDVPSGATAVGIPARIIKRSAAEQDDCFLDDENF
ncbi:MAG: serine O-acetyltransferase [Microcoleaceae cyanobacterium]